MYRESSSLGVCKFLTYWMLSCLTIFSISIFFQLRGCAWFKLKIIFLGEEKTYWFLSSKANKTMQSSGSLTVLFDGVMPVKWQVDQRHFYSLGFAKNHKNYFWFCRTISVKEKTIHLHRALICIKCEEKFARIQTPMVTEKGSCCV